MGGIFASYWWQYALAAAEKAVPTERALVDVAITGKGDGTYQDGQTREANEVKITTNRGHSVWVSEKDVYGTYKPNPEAQ